MWTLFKKSDAQGPLPAAAGKNGQASSDVRTFRRRQFRTVLTPTIVGSMVVMMPRYEDGVGPDWPGTIPPIE
jgi:hypothetical protein